MTENDNRKLFGTQRGVVFLGLARMADALGNSFLIVVLPLYIVSEGVSGETFGFSPSFITGFILGLYGLISSLLQPVAGWLSDSMGKRRFFVLIGLLFFTFANISYSLADSYFMLVLIRSAQGVAAALTITASVALVSELSTDTSRGNNMGVYNSLRLIGFGGGPLISGLVIEHGPFNVPLLGQISGFNAAFAIAAAAAAISAFFVLFFVRDPEDTRPSKKRIQIKVRADQNGRLIDPIFALGLATLIMSFGFSILAPIETETNARLGQGPFLFSVEFSAMVAALALFQPFVGRASDRYGRRVFIIIGLCCLIPTSVAQGLSAQSWHMIAARAVQGLSAAMVLAPALALAGDLAEKGQAAARLSVVTMAFGLGISIGSFVSGYAVGFGYITPFLIASGLAALGVLIVYTQVPKTLEGREKKL